MEVTTLVGNFNVFYLVLHDFSVDIAFYLLLVAELT